MQRNEQKNFLIIIFLIVVIAHFFFKKNTLADSIGTINFRVQISVCGNNITETGEQCDGSDLNGATCQTLGYAGGTLVCQPDCTFNTSGCISGSGGGGGGGGGGISGPPSGSITQVIFSGKAYPKSKVFILKDAQIITFVNANDSGDFMINLGGFYGGNYIFSIYAEDQKKRRSPALTFPIFVNPGAITKIENIFIAPTIAVDKIEVKKGDDIAIFGQSFPQADIIISINSEKEFLKKTVADKNGNYFYNLNTSNIDYGVYYVKSKAFINDIASSSFSNVINFKVGTKNVFTLPTEGCPQKADLNGDCRVNLVDFSIAAYWYKRTLSPEFAQKEKEQLNGDGKVDLVDFSIMAYYWTG